MNTMVATEWITIIITRFLGTMTDVVGFLGQANGRGEVSGSTVIDSTNVTTLLTTIIIDPYIISLLK